MNIVVPYISIRSPTLWASTLIASDQASIVPVMTGVPTASPVRAAASWWTVPATSVAQRSGGISSSGAIRFTHGTYQSRAWVSYRGVAWLAD
jgi:hypothetical protein